MSSAQSKVVPFSLKDAPALIEKVFPVQRLSVEAYKEQMAVHGKTLTALGSYWKGRKPLILNRACILGCLLPAGENLTTDLEIFELLMGMDEGSIKKRLKLSEEEPVPSLRYKELIDEALRPEEILQSIDSHIWGKVNKHLGTSAGCISDLVEQLGIMRFGHIPRFSDTFCGSGQIPFEAARLGCDVEASDLNPIACMLTWGAFNIVGASVKSRQQLLENQKRLSARVQVQIDELGIESDGAGWRAKVFLYCIEALCPQSGWTVPLLPSRIVSVKKKVIAELIPDPSSKRYDIIIRTGVSDDEMNSAKTGTITREGKFSEACLNHTVEGRAYKTKISTLRGDFEGPDGIVTSQLRKWEKTEFKPRSGDLFQERLYCIQWAKLKGSGKAEITEFRSVTEEDLEREKIVEVTLSHWMEEWQAKGIIPDMRIEIGGPPRYQGLDLVRGRGWTHWHHVFAPRQLLVAGMVMHERTATNAIAFCRALDRFSKLSIWNAFAENTEGAFYNQALNTLYNYGVRGSKRFLEYMEDGPSSFPLDTSKTNVVARSAIEMDRLSDVLITDPPYGDAVKYEEILDFFIAWLRKNPPKEFANWSWDSRRALAIKGEDEDFRRGMVAAYKKMADCMPDNGIQIIMFTHQSGAIWADMANIVWASGLQVSAAWYVVTETDSALRDGSHVKGTVLLVLRKQFGERRTTRDDLAWDIKEEVEKQVATLTGLNQQTKPRYRDENLFADADLQMAGYAAALRVLTQYSVIDGKEMVTEAIRPRVKGQKTFVDELIEFAVGVANQSLVPRGIEKSHWDKFKPAERFYLKLLELESQGAKTLDNYQNFAKAFKVADFKPLMAASKANAARLKSAVELGKLEMTDGAELGNTALRGVLYAVMELVKGEDGNDVLTHLSFNVENYYDPEVREVLAELSEYLASKLTELRPEEASSARVLRELIKNQKL